MRQRYAFGVLFAILLESAVSLEFHNQNDFGLVLVIELDAYVPSDSRAVTCQFDRLHSEVGTVNKSTA